MWAIEILRGGCETVVGGEGVPVWCREGYAYNMKQEGRHASDMQVQTDIYTLPSDVMSL